MGICAPKRSVLLYSVPGTVKMLLTRVLTVKGKNTTFFVISASSIMSKFRVDREKLMRMLFNLA